MVSLQGNSDVPYNELVLMEHLTFATVDHALPRPSQLFHVGDGDNWTPIIGADRLNPQAISKN